MGQEQWAKALKAGEHALDQLPKSERRLRSFIRCMQATCHQQLTQFEQSLSKALRATEEDRSFGQAWVNLGGARHNLEQYDEAVTCFETALELGVSADGKQVTQEWLTQARVAAAAAAAAGDAAEAADLGLFVNDPKWLEDAEYVRFLQLLQQEQWVKALDLGAFVLDELPERERWLRSGICCNQAGCHAALKQREQALQKALQATEEDRSYGVAWSQLGSVRGSLGQFDEAVTFFDSALELGLSAKHKQHAQEYLKKAWEEAAEKKAAAEAAALAQGAAAKPSGGGEAKPQQPPQPPAAASLSCTVCGQERETHSCSGCKKRGRA